ncbi:MAG TPA: hypothetical protein VIJ02_03895 [Thermoanaerobaculia bacterium]
MGLPQPLSDALRDFEPAETAVRARQAPRLEDVRAIEANLERLQSCSRKIFEEMERKVAAGERPEDLDETIDSLLETEEEFKRELLPYVDRARQQQADSLSSRWIEAILGGLRVLRDLRWDLMALRAETEPPGDAPVFDNPRALLEYLKTTR